MAKKSMPTEICSAPSTLESHPFYGMSLDESQAAFRDALWEPTNKFVGVEACAGSGKTTIAIATACLLYHYNRMDGIVYIRVPVSEDRRLGFLPGLYRKRHVIICNHFIIHSLGLEKTHILQ